jgi:hypothetical protein
MTPTKAGRLQFQRNRIGNGIRRLHVQGEREYRVITRSKVGNHLNRTFIADQIGLAEPMANKQSHPWLCFLKIRIEPGCGLVQRAFGIDAGLDGGP